MFIRMTYSRTFHEPVAPFSSLLFSITNLCFQPYSVKSKPSRKGPMVFRNQLSKGTGSSVLSIAEIFEFIQHAFFSCMSGNMLSTTFGGQEARFLPKIPPLGSHSFLVKMLTKWSVGGIQDVCECGWEKGIFIFTNS